MVSWASRQSLNVAERYLKAQITIFLEQTARQAHGTLRLKMQQVKQDFTKLMSNKIEKICKKQILQIIVSKTKILLLRLLVK